MYTKVKTPEEIESMRVAGKMCSDILKLLAKTVSPGISSKDLANIAAKEIKSFGASAAFLGYNGFPDVICISINDEVVHGIPDSKKIVQSGDIISFDLGVTYQKMIVDSAVSVLVDSTDSQKIRLLDSTKLSLKKAVESVKDGCTTGDIGASAEKVLADQKLGIVRDLVGHGVGHQVHEDPNIPNYGSAGSGPILQAGMTIAVEPMATLGGESVYIDTDGWTVKTLDKSLAAHFEQTILVTKSGYEILTPFK